MSNIDKERNELKELLAGHSSGALAIVNERLSQLYDHGFTIEEDIKVYPAGTLRSAALAILCKSELLWPWRNTRGMVTWRNIMSKGEADQLVYAGALLAAEVDTLQRRWADKQIAKGKTSA